MSRFPFRACRRVAACVALAALLGGAGAATAVDAPAPKGVAQQVQLDIALAAYERGDLAQAEAAFRTLAAQDLPVAWFNLAMMHLRDEITPADPAEAVRLLQRAAQAGFVRAEHALGEVHEQGVLGRPDLVEAHRWYLRAAVHGHVDAQVSMGTAYFLGRGAPRDMAQAAHWYREAAKAGEVGAQYILASMYEHGDGVPQDLRLARYWYQAAADNGDDAAPGKLRQLDASR